ncbi:MAG: hypothetical protein OEV42_04360 [Deltaproteobacteria bacterium]|nr:hypothetical protein [Deltaproteobacteria bacterium]
MSGQSSLIDKILDQLHPDYIGRKIEYLHNIIRENWTVKVYIPEDYKECMKILCDYYRYHFCAMFNISINMPNNRAHHEVKKIMEKSKGGYVQGVKNAIRGRHGGMIALIDALAEEIKNDAIEKHISYVIDTHISPLDFEVQCEVIEQYLNKYAKYMIPGEEMMSPYLLAANYQKVIRMHIEVIRRYRESMQ